MVNIVSSSCNPPENFSVSSLESDLSNSSTNEPGVGVELRHPDVSAGEIPHPPSRKRRKVSDGSRSTSKADSVPAIPAPEIGSHKLKASFLGHILGEEIISKTEFQGMATCDAVGAMKNCLSTLQPFILNFVNKNSLQAPSILDKQKLWECLQYIEKILENTLFFKVEDSSALQKKEACSSVVLQFQGEMQNRLQMLHTTGVPFLIEGGWMGKPGHALYYLVFKDERAGPTEDYRSMACSIGIFNIGGGVSSYHPSLNDCREVKYFPYIVLDAIPAKNFLNPYLLQALITIQNMSTMGNMNEYDAPDVYESILEVLGGTRRPMEGLSEDSYVPRQKSGICAIAGLMQVIKSFLDACDKDWYQLFRHYCELQALFDLNQITSCNEQEQTLFRLCTEKFARNCLARKNLLSPSELAASLQMCETLSQSIEKMWELPPVAQSTQISVKPKKMCKTPLYLASPTFSMRDRGLSSLSPFLNDTDSRRFQDPLQFSHDLFVALGEIDKDWKGRDLSSEKKSNYFFCKTSSFSDKENQLKKLALFVENIHCPQADFFGQIPLEDIPSCMEAISFCTHLFIARRKEILSIIPEANVRLYVMKLTAIQHRLFAESKLIPNFAENHGVMIDQLFFGNRKNDLVVFASAGDFLSLPRKNLQLQYEKVWEYLYSRELGKGYVRPVYATEPVKIVSKIPPNSHRWEPLLEELLMANPSVFTALPTEIQSPRAAMYAFALSDMEAKHMPAPFVAWHTQLLSAYVFLSFLDKRFDFKEHVPYIPQFSVEFASESTNRVLYSPYQFQPITEKNGKKAFEELVRGKAFAQPFAPNTASLGYSQGYVLSNMEKDFGSLSEIEREFVGTVTNEAQLLPSLFLEKLLSFCASHPEFLNEVSYQKIIYEILTSPRLVQRAVHENPEIKKILYHTLQEGAVFAKKCKQIATGCFYAGLLHFVNTVCGEKEAVLSAKSFVGELFGLCKNRTEKSLCARHLILVCGETKEECAFSDLSDFLAAYVYLANYPLPKEYAWPLLDYTVQRIRDEFGPLLQSLIHSEAGKDVLSNAINLIFNDTCLPQGTAWDISKYPLCTTSNGFSVNLSTGVASKKGRELTPLPLEIQRVMKRAFPGIDSSLPPEICDNSLFFDDGRVEIFPVQDLDSSLVSIRRKIGGDWYSLKQHVRGAHGSISGFIDRMMLWVNKELAEVLFFSNRDGELFARASLKEFKKSTQCINITNCKNHLVFVPLDPATKAQYAFLEKIELFEDIYLWQDESGRHRRIDLLKKGLSCEIEVVDGQTKIFMSYPQGFFISENQKLKSIPGIENYLLLENDFGFKKVLIPFLEVNSTEVSLHPLRSGMRLQFDYMDQFVNQDCSEERKTPPYLIFDVTKEGELIGSCKSHNLYLAYLYFATKRFKDSLNLLRKQYERPFKEDEVDKQVFAWTYHLIQKQFSTVPEVTSMTLLFFLLYSRTRGTTVFTDLWKKKEITEIYNKYLGLLDELGECLLLQSEELELIEMLRWNNGLPSIQILFRHGELTHQPLLQLPPTSGEVEQSFLETAGPRINYDWSKVTTIPEVRNILRGGVPVNMNFPLFLKKAARDDVRSLVQLSKNDSRLDRYFYAFFHNSLECGELCRQIKMGLEANATDWPKIQLPHVNYKRVTNATSLVTPGKTTVELPPVCVSPPDAVSITPLFTDEERGKIFAERSMSKFIIEPDQLRARVEQLLQIGSKNGYEKNFQDLVSQITEGNTSIDGCGFCLRPDIPIGTIKSLLLEKKRVQDPLVENSLSELLRLANSPQGKVEDILERQLQLSGRILSPINEKDLLLFFAFQDTKYVVRKQRCMSVETCRELNEKILLYLIQATRKQQIERALRHIEKFEKTHDCEEPRLRETLAAELVAQREFFPHKNPLYIVFEYMNDLLLRNVQVECLDRVKENDNAAFQLSMGAGKTKVILPLAALGKVRAGLLPLIIVPKPLFKTMYTDMHAQITGRFGFPVGALRFTRHSDYSAGAMSKLLEELKRIKESSGCVIATPHSIACFVLALELKVIGGEKREEEALETMTKILKFFKQEGSALADELDLILSNRHETNFALGETTPMSQGNIDCVADIFQTLVSHFGDKEIVADSALFQEIKSDIIRKCFDRQCERVFEAYKIEFSEQERTKLFQFVCETCELDESLSWLPREVVHVFSILRGEFAKILPLTLAKRCNTAYGFSSVPTKEIVIPYAGSNTPLKGSEFGNPYEVLNYTMQAFLNSSFDARRFENAVTHLQNKVRADRLSGIPLEQLASFQMLSYFAGTSEIDPSDKKLYETIAEHVRKDRNLLVEFVRTIVFPLVSEYAQKITMTAPGLVDVFGCFQGFSGTPWNASTYPRSMKLYADAKREGEQICRLLKLDPALISLPSDSPSDVLLFVQKNFRPTHRAFIDAGAFFRGLTNEYVARRLLEILPPQEIDSVAFYSGNQLMVLRRDHAASIPFEEDSLPQKRYTYYDQKHTSGADIVHLLLAEASVSVSNDLLLRDLLQAIYRMRETGKGQKIELLLSPAVVTSIQALIPSASGIIGVLALCAILQFRQLQEHQILAVSQIAQQGVKQSVLQSIITDPQDKTEQAKNCFIHTTRDDPYTAYGKAESLVTREEYIDAKIKENLARSSLSWSPDLQSSLEKALHEVSLPRTFYASQCSESSTYEQEVETSKELHMHLSVQAPVLNPPQITILPQQKRTEVDPWMHFSLEESDQVPLKVFEACQLLPQELQGIFDPYIKISSNIFPGGNQRSAFDIHQPPVQYLLMAQIEGILHTRILSLDENAWFYPRLWRKCVRRNVPMGIYDLQLRTFIIRAGDPTVNLELHPYFSFHRVQAKFFGGQVSYTDEEIELLRSWACTAGAENLKKAFLYIIRNNAQKQCDFNRSILKRLL